MDQTEIARTLTEQHARILFLLDRLLQTSSPMEIRKLLTSLQQLMVKHRTFEADVLAAGFRSDPAMRIFADQSTAEMASLTTDILTIARDNATPQHVSENKQTFVREIKSVADRLRVHFGKQESVVISKLELTPR